MAMRKVVLIAHLSLVFSIVVWALIAPSIELSLFKGQHAMTVRYLRTAPVGELELTAREQLELRADQVAGLSLGELGTHWCDGFLRLSPALQGWLLFSLVLALLLLLGVEGISIATWLLPLIAILYLLMPPSSESSAVEEMVPSEQTIIQNYLQEPLAGSISDQRSQLLRGWELYLVREWAGEEPAAEVERRSEQRRIGEYRFQLARLLRLEPPRATPPRIAPPLYLLFLGWNLFFAIAISVRSKARRTE